MNSVALFVGISKALKVLYWMGIIKHATEKTPANGNVCNVWNLN